MDATVNTALDTLTSGLQTDALGIISDYLPEAGVVMVTVAVLFFGIRIFRAIAHV
jgi:hypothetical protein